MKFSHASLLATLLLSCSPAFAATPRLKVSDNKHFLVTETGAPFFVGATAGVFRVAMPAALGHRRTA